METKLIQAQNLNLNRPCLIKVGHGMEDVAEVIGAALCEDGTHVVIMVQRGEDLRSFTLDKRQRVPLLVETKRAKGKSK